MGQHPHLATSASKSTQTRATLSLYNERRIGVSSGCSSSCGQSHPTRGLSAWEGRRGAELTTGQTATCAGDYCMWARGVIGATDVCIVEESYSALQHVKVHNWWARSFNPNMPFHLGRCSSKCRCFFFKRQWRTIIRAKYYNQEFKSLWIHVI